MSFEDVLRANDFILTEATVIKSLRRSKKVSLHPRLEHALMIYNETEKDVLSSLYGDYISVALNAGVPSIIMTPTWRANKERLTEAGITRDVNRDAVRYLRVIREKFNTREVTIPIGGLIGCKNDCYIPREGLGTKEAYDFHVWQVNKLADAGAEFLIAETLSALPEAIGIAQAMSTTGIPYIISFVINRDGALLDDTGLAQVFHSIDTICERPPIGYMINCSYPSFLRLHEQRSSVISRLVGFQANASSRDQSELEGSVTLYVDDIPEWGNQMIELNRRYGIKILGGCCGTNTRHLQFIVDNIES